MNQLRSERWTDRREAVTAVLGIPAAQRSLILIEHVVREITRLQSHPDKGFSEVPAGFDPETGWEYYADLVEVACGSDNPIVIGPIVTAIAALAKLQ